MAALTGTQILQFAEHHTEGDNIPTWLALQFINECIVMDLGKEARVVASANITVEADTWTALPDGAAGLLEIFEITQAGWTVPYHGTKYGVLHEGAYDLRGGQIRLPHAGTYTIWFYTAPAPLASLNATPAIHSLFHYPISLFVASRYKSSDNEGNPDAHRLMNEYRVYRQKAINEMAKISPTTKAAKVIKPRPWR